MVGFWQGPASAPKRAIRAVDVGAPSGGTDGLPREDISGKLTATLLKNLSSPDWKASIVIFGRVVCSNLLRECLLLEG